MESHDWIYKKAEKKKIGGRGKASAGILVGKRKGWGGNNWEIIENNEEGILHIKLKKKRCKNVLGNLNTINIIAVYNSIHRKDIGEIITKMTNEYERGGVIVGGDFNIRIGELGGEGEEWGVTRKSKDKTIGNGGTKFIDKMLEGGLNVLNGKTEGDWEGEYTYVGARGSTVIDYIFVNNSIYEKVLTFRVEDRVDSDHLPLTMEIEEEDEEEVEEERRGPKTRKKGKENIGIKKVISWDEEAKERYRENTEKIGWEEVSNETSIDMYGKNLKI